MLKGLTKGRIVHYVLLDGTNDYEDSTRLFWATSKTYDESGKPGTWHWIPRV